MRALDRFDRVLPLSPAVLSVKTTAKHTSAEFVVFLAELVAGQPEDREIHVLAGPSFRAQNRPG
jgi:hypothetical protein